jgi:hypothetical protein
MCSHDCGKSHSCGNKGIFYCSKASIGREKVPGCRIAQIDLRHGGTGMVVTPALVNSSLQISMKCLAVQAGNLEDFWR